MGTVLLVTRTELLEALKYHWSWTVLASLLGAVAGAAELISRYRDDPIDAVTSAAGLFYITLNALISACAYGLLTQYATQLIPSVASDPLMRALISGLGAMALLRSKFFTVRTEKGEDVPVGPDIVVRAFLEAADRGVDRTRASRRLSLVSETTSSIQRPDLGEDFLIVALAAFQNISEDEKRTMLDLIKSIATSELPEDLKLQAMCYGILQLTGERNFRDLMSNLQSYETRPGIDTVEPAPETTAGATNRPDPAPSRKEEE